MEGSLPIARKHSVPHSECQEAIFGYVRMGCFEPPSLFP